MKGFVSEGNGFFKSILIVESILVQRLTYTLIIFKPNVEEGFF